MCKRITHIDQRFEAAASLRVDALSDRGAYSRQFKICRLMHQGELRLERKANPPLVVRN